MQDAFGEILLNFLKTQMLPGGGGVNDVKTHNKLQDPDCYHIILCSRHNKLAKKHNEPLPRVW